MAYVNFLIVSPYGARIKGIKRAISELMERLQPMNAQVHKPAFHSHLQVNHYKIFSEVAAYKPTLAVVDMEICENARKFLRTVDGSSFSTDDLYKNLQFALQVVRGIKNASRTVLVAVVVPTTNESINSYLAEQGVNVVIHHRRHAFPSISFQLELPSVEPVASAPNETTTAQKIPEFFQYKGRTLRPETLKAIKSLKN